MIDGEVVVLDSSASFLETGTSTGQVFVRRSAIMLDADTGTGNDASAVINYGGRAVTGTVMSFEQSQLICGPFTGRRNIQVTSLIDTKIIEQDDTGQLFVYTSDGAVLDTVLMRGINTWEIVGPPSVLFNVSVDTVNKAFLNWEGGRLDFYNFAVKNRPAGTAQADAWFGTGASTNAAWMWNNVDFNNQRMYLTATNNRYYDGVTISWEFVDRDTLAPVADVKVKVKDDFPGFNGTMTERGEYLTGADGHIDGVWDGRLRTNVASGDRDTIFMVRNAVTRVSTGSPGSFTYPTSVISGDQGNRSANYAIDPVTNQIEIKAYAYEAPGSHLLGVNFDTTGPIGRIRSDLSVEAYQAFILAPDSGVTELDRSVVLGYTGLNTLEKLFDRTKAEWYENDGYPLPVNNGAIIDLGPTDLIIDGNAASAFSYASGPDEITINPTAAPTIIFVGQSEAVSVGEADQITISFPPGIQDDDYAMIIVGHAQADENTWNTPAGWVVPTGLAEVLTGGSPASHPGVSVFRRILSGDSGSVVITNAGTNVSGIVAQMRVYRNVDTTNPEDVVSVTTTGASGNPDPASITPVNDGAMVVAIGFQDDGNQAAPTAPAGYGNLMATATTDGAGGGE